MNFNDAKSKTAGAYIGELEQEAVATRKCLEQIPAATFDWKPHEKSMSMLRLATLVAAMYGWITKTLETSEIDFATFKPYRPKTTTELVEYFDKNLSEAKDALRNASDEDFNETYTLRNGDHIVGKLSKGENIRSTINHFAHHRGQLTVFMRLKDIPVPAIYGPSADSNQI